MLINARGGGKNLYPVATVEATNISWLLRLDVDQCHQVVLAAEQGEALTQLRVEPVQLFLESVLAFFEHVEKLCVTMVVFHAIFIVFCVPVPFMNGYLSTFLGKYAIFWDKNLEEWGKVRIFAAEKRYFKLPSVHDYHGHTGEATEMSFFIF